MKTRNRVEKLLEQARVIARNRRRAVRQRQCQDATWEELLGLVGKAIPAESWPVVQDILKQIEEYRQRPSRELANGEMRTNVHGFVEWMIGLWQGWAALPETIPHVVLLAWRNGYANHPARSTPIPIQRCEDCHMVLPNCGPDGLGRCSAPCPVCGSDRLSHMNLWAWGTFSFW
jgi:hypothetical protein